MYENCNLEERKNSSQKSRKARRVIASILAASTILTLGVFGFKKKLENNDEVLGMRISYSTYDGLDIDGPYIADKKTHNQKVNVIKYESLDDIEAEAKVYDITDANLYNINDCLNFDVSGRRYETFGLKANDENAESLNGHQEVVMNLNLLNK